MRAELVRDETDKDKVYIVRLTADTDEERTFLSKAYQEGLRAFLNVNNCKTIGMSLPSTAELKQFHIPKKVVDWLNTILSEGLVER